MPSKPQHQLRLKSTSHPILYEVNIRILLNELSNTLGRRITLDKIPDSVIDEWASSHFDAVWLMGIWTVGKRGIAIARAHEELRKDYAKALPDFTDDDVIGSPYAVKSYTVSRSLGGAKALCVVREKLAARGMGLVLDFVSNHTALDHVWVSTHPEYFIRGAEGDDQNKPESYFETSTKRGERVIAYGRDPYFPGWTDTAQLNPRHAGARKAMIDTLLSISKQCDGVRCDMAMLLLNEVFQKTWGEQSNPIDGEAALSEFWGEAIQFIRKKSPDFLFIAEAYWNLEWPLQELGFDYTYDKTLYDRLLREGATSVYDHLKAESLYQQRSARFLENHDEPRIAYILPNEAWQYAAATVVATVPGMLLLHEGQLEGRTVKIPVQLGRRPAEPVSVLTKTFYMKLLACLEAEVIKNGTWQLSTVHPGWPDNYSYQNILCYSWRNGESLRLIIVNYAPRNSQCYVEISLNDFAGDSFEFRDIMSPLVYVRDRLGLQHKGMYFDMPGYNLHVFEVKPMKPKV